MGVFCRSLPWSGWIRRVGWRFRVLVENDFFADTKFVGGLVRLLKGSAGKSGREGGLNQWQWRAINQRDECRGSRGQGTDWEMGGCVIHPVPESDLEATAAKLPLPRFRLVRPIVISHHGLPCAATHRGYCDKATKFRRPALNRRRVLISCKPSLTHISCPTLNHLTMMCCLLFRLRDYFSFLCITFLRHCCSCN